MVQLTVPEGKTIYLAGKRYASGEVIPAQFAHLIEQSDKKSSGKSSSKGAGSSSSGKTTSTDSE